MTVQTTMAATYLPARPVETWDEPECGEDVLDGEDEVVAVVPEGELLPPPLPLPLLLPLLLFITTEAGAGYTASGGRAGRRGRGAGAVWEW